MNGNDLLSCMDLVDPELVEKADKPVYTPVPAPFRWGSLAASIALVCMLGVFLMVRPFLFGMQAQPSPTKPDHSDHTTPMPTSPAEISPKPTEPVVVNPTQPDAEEPTPTETVPTEPTQPAPAETA